MYELPNFFLVGAQKAGTSSLYAYLKQHPDIYLPAVKEPHFFSQVMPSHQYQSIFLPSVLKDEDYLKLYRDARGFAAVGEASVSYLWDAKAPQRMHTWTPRARILIVLRDPVERAYSHYLMNVREGVERLPFYEALLANRREQPTGWGRSRLYIEAGLYAAQIQRFIDVFGPDQVRILQFEDLKLNAAGVLRQVAAFLGVDPDATKDIRTEDIHNPHLVHRGPIAASIMRSRSTHLWARRFVPKPVRAWVRYELILQQGRKPPPDPRSVDMLRTLYEPDLQALERILMRPLPCLRMVK